MRHRSLVLSLAVGTALAAGLASHARSGSAVGPRFATDGSLLLPVDYRQWVHVGTRYKPIGINILDHKVTATPEIFNTYVEPVTYASFKKTGRWPVRAEIVKEFSRVRVGNGCDASGMCSSPLGRGIFETGYMGLGVMVKDPARFPNSPGNWGYFSFGHRPPPYLASSHVDGACSDCHVALASKSDYVISAAHIGLDTQ